MTDVLDELQKTPSVAARFVIRRLDLEPDLAALARLTNEIEAADESGETVTEADLRSHLTAPAYDIARDGWVVEEPGAPHRLIAEGATIHINNTARAYGHVAVYIRHGGGRGLGGS